MAQTLSRPEEVAQQIKRRWQDRGLTQKDMGETLGLDPEVAGRRLRGTIQFKLSELGLIADRLEEDVVVEVGPEATVTFRPRATS